MTFLSALAPRRCSSRPLALLVAYVLVQRRRHTQVLRFTSVDLLDSVAPSGPGWQRHVPAAALLLALVVLTLAFAQPAMAMRTRQGPRDDHAHPRHLRVDDARPTSRRAGCAAMEEQAKTFVKNLPKGIQVGLVTFDGERPAARAAEHRHRARCSTRSTR